MSVQITDEELIQEVYRVAWEIDGNTPRSTDMREIGEYSVVTYANRFGSWNAALEKAGLGVNKESPGGPGDIGKAELVSDVHRIAEKVGRTPAFSDVQKHGKHSFAVYLRHLSDCNGAGKWNDILRKLGYEPNRVEKLFERDCDMCGDTMQLRKCEVEMDYHLCSRECYHEYQSEHLVGEKRYNYKEESTDYGPGWNFNKKEQVRMAYDRQCQACGITEERHKEKHGRKLSVHHVIPASKFERGDPAQNDMSNLVPLCIKHHKKWEGIPLKPMLIDEVDP